MNNNSNKQQNLLLIDSHFYEYLNYFLFFLHILALTLGIITIFLVQFSNVNSSQVYTIIQHIFEIVTLSIIFSLIIIDFSKPKIKRTYLKLLFGEFWGESIIEFVIYKPSNINLKNKEVVEKEVINEERKVNIQFIRYQLLRYRLVIEVIDKENNKIQFFSENIILNPEKQTVEALFTKLDENEEVFMTFNQKNKKIYWSGILPNNPIYGEWIWKK